MSKSTQQLTTEVIESINRINSGKQCDICYEKMIEQNKIATLKCGHKFHKRCIGKWAGDPKHNENDRSKTCPMCRGPLHVKMHEGYIRRETSNGGRNRTRRRNKNKQFRKTYIKKHK